MSRRSYRDAYFGAGGASAGPYSSSGDAYRAAVLEGQLVPLDQGGKTLEDWDAVTPTAVPEVANADGMYTGLRCDPQVSEGDAVGYDLLYDAASDSFVGTRRTPLTAIATARDDGITRGTSATDDDTTPGFVLSLYDGSGTFSWMYQVITRGAGAAGLVGVANNVPIATGAGVGLNVNNAQMNMGVTTLSGDTIGLSSGTGGGTTVVSGTLDPDTVYTVVASIARITTNTIRLRLKVFDLSGTIVQHRHRTSGSGFSDADLPTSAMSALVQFSGFFRTYPGFDLPQYGDLPDVLDGTDITAGGQMDLNLIGVRTGVYRPGDLTQLIHATGSGDEVLCVSRRA